jgi:hypothetical protein
LTVHGVKNVWQTEIHTAEPLVPESSSFEVKIDVEKLKKYKSATELITQEVKHYVLWSTYLLIIFGIRRYATALEGISIIVPIYEKGV